MENIYNILNFEKEYPEAKVIKLEQNYRSTGNILKAANGVISNNEGRKDKALWTSSGDGEKISFDLYDTEYLEADGVVSEIVRRHRGGRPYHHFAILYRTNAQSRVFEEKLMLKNVPYRIIGGQNFYGRREIKDILAYLKTIDNARDDVAVRRIINVPKRGIGQTTVDRVAAFAAQNDISFYTALCRPEDIPGIGSAVTTAMCGKCPLRLRIKFSASVRLFWARSLRMVHFADIDACKMSLPPLLLRRSALLQSVSSTKASSLLISASSHNPRDTITSGDTK